MKLLQVLPLLPLCMSAPQYGGGASQPVKAPVQSSQVSCRTEYAEVWDTEYVETETQECQTVQEKQCNTEYKKQCVPTQRQECQTVYRTEYEQVCSQKYRDETEYYTETECNTDYKQAVSTSGRARGITRCGRPSRGLARTMLMT